MNPGLAALHERIDALEAMIMVMRRQMGDHLLLAERNFELRRALGAREKMFPRAWRLCRQEQLFLSTLLAAPGGQRSLEHLMAAMFVREIAPSIHGVHVVACRVRAKLRPLKVEIINHFGVGYSLPPGSKCRIESAMASEH